MGVLQKCCFCCNVRRGSFYCGIYCLVTSLLFVSLMVVRFLGYRILQQNGTLPGIAFAIIGIFIVEIICTILLLIGVHKDLRHLISTWLITTLMTMLLPTCGFIWIIVTSLWDTGEIHGLDLAISSFHFCNTIILIYCVLCVIAQLQDLIKGKGTAEAYRRRRQRRRMIQAFTEMQLPLDVELDLFHRGPVPPAPILTPPPYSDKPPSYRDGTDEPPTGERRGPLNHSNDGHSNGTNDIVRSSDIIIHHQETSQETGETNPSINLNSVEIPSERNGHCQEELGGRLNASDRPQTSQLAENQDIRTCPEVDPDHVESNIEQPPVSGLAKSQKSNEGHCGSNPDQSSNASIDVHQRRGQRQGRSSNRSNPTSPQITPCDQIVASTSASESPNYRTTDKYHRDEYPGNGHVRPGKKPRSTSARQENQGSSNEPRNVNINKPKGKAKKNKGNNAIVLRSYERNDQFNDGAELRRFEYTPQNREGVYPV